jgi:lantibiotic biosynthesis protein
MDEASWEPILDGPAADAARLAVRALVDDLARAEVAPADVPDVALFLAYAAGVEDADDAVGAAHAAVMDRLVEIAGEEPRAFGLYGAGALSGRAFVMAHTADGVDEYLAGVDGMLDQLFAAPEWTEDYDLIQGLTGAAIYLLERADVSPRAASALGHVVRHLDALHRELPDGIAWWTPGRLLPPSQIKQYPDGYYNCGVAHGIAGVIVALGRIAARPDAPPRARPLYDGAVRWLLAQRLDDPRNPFPSWVVPGRPPVPTRTAWCYGDAGTAAALWAAAARLGEPTETCAALARGAATRPFELCQLNDTPLCHGAFGLAHLFNRCYQASGDPVLRGAARGWYERGLAMRLPGSTEFVRTHADASGMATVAPGHDLLEGKAGIGLALLAAITPIEPAWDTILACDIPVRGAAP